MCFRGFGNLHDTGVDLLRAKHQRLAALGQLGERRISLGHLARGALVSPENLADGFFRLACFPCSDSGGIRRRRCSLHCNVERCPRGRGDCRGLAQNIRGSCHLARDVRELCTPSQRSRPGNGSWVVVARVGRSSARLVTGSGRQVRATRASAVVYRCTLVRQQGSWRILRFAPAP